MSQDRTLAIGISNSDYSALISSIYDAVHSGDWAKPMNHIIDATQSNKAFFFMQDLAKSDEPVWLEWHTNFDCPQQALLEYHSRPFEDPFYSVNRLVTEGESININEHIEFDTYRETDYYRDVFEPMKVHHALSGCLIRDGKHESAWATNRAKDDPPYSLEDMNLITLITPHLSRALQLHINMQARKTYASLGQRILEQTNKGLIVCDVGGRVKHKNDFAVDLLDRLEGISLEGDRIELEESSENDRLKKYIEQCASYSFGGMSIQETISLTGPEDAVITVTPLRRNEGNEQDELNLALVSIVLLASLKWDSVSQAFELTPRETQLLQAIYRKRKLNELTDEFGVTYNTLRSHLQNIFKKTHVNSQTELMVKLGLFKG